MEERLDYVSRSHKGKVLLFPNVFEENGDVEVKHYVLEDYVIH